jgi:hypothetical protein
MFHYQKEDVMLEHNQNGPKDHENSGIPSPKPEDGLHTPAQPNVPDEHSAGESREPKEPFDSPDRPHLPDDHHPEGPHKPEKIFIIVNGRKCEWEKTTITFDEVVVLAFEKNVISDTLIYKVTYSKGIGKNREGIMVTGDIIDICQGMVFNATPTNRS